MAELNTAFAAFSPHRLRPMLYSTEVKETAKRLFLRRCKAKEIQAQLNLPSIRIVYYSSFTIMPDLSLNLEPFLLVARSTKGVAAAKVIMDATAAVCHISAAVMIFLIVHSR